MSNAVKNSNPTIRATKADGTVVESTFTFPVAFKKDIDERVRNHILTTSYKLAKDFDDVVRGYFSLLPNVSEMLKNKMWKECDNVKGANQFLIMVTGCSKATASELIKVAGRFYSSGKLDNKFESFKVNIEDLDELGYNIEEKLKIGSTNEADKTITIPYRFSYSDLIKMAQLDDDDMDNFLEKCQDLIIETKGKLTRKAIETNIKNVQAEGMAEKDSQEENNIDPESIQTDTESSGSTAEPNENENENENENDSTDLVMIQSDENGFIDDTLVVKSISDFLAQDLDKDVTKFTKTELQEKLHLAKILLHEIMDYIQSPAVD